MRLKQKFFNSSPKIQSKKIKECSSKNKEEERSILLPNSLRSKFQSKSSKWKNESSKEKFKVNSKSLQRLKSKGSNYIKLTPIYTLSILGFWVENFFNSQPKIRSKKSKEYSSKNKEEERSILLPKFSWIKTTIPKM